MSRASYLAGETESPQDVPPDALDHRFTVDPNTGEWIDGGPTETWNGSQWVLSNGAPVFPQPARPLPVDNTTAANIGMAAVGGFVLYAGAAAGAAAETEGATVATDFPPDVAPLATDFPAETAAPSVSLPGYLRQALPVILSRLQRRSNVRRVRQPNRPSDNRRGFSRGRLRSGGGRRWFRRA